MRRRNTVQMVLELLPRVGGRQRQDRHQKIASRLRLEGCECGDSVLEMGPREKPQISTQGRNTKGSPKKSSCTKAERTGGLLKALGALTGLAVVCVHPSEHATVCICIRADIREYAAMCVHTCL